MSYSIASQLSLSSPNLSQRFVSSTLTLQEGKQLLKQLVLGSPEYLQLQNVLLKTAGIFEITTGSSCYKIHTGLDDSKLLGGFGGGEHLAIGEATRLQGLEGDQTVLTVGPHQLRFSHIVALAGDFYAISGEAISLPGGNDRAKTVRFQNAFNTLVHANHEELKAILDEIHQESRDVKESGTPHHCYSHCNAKGMSALKKIKADYEDLLIDNSDHFEKNAEDAYRIGHTLALQVAKEAGQTQNKEKLKYAYALDAFACHFLTDLFAAGHIRNQRGALEVFLRDQLKFSNLMSKKIAGLLTGAQHEEDGKKGLKVQNQEGRVWKSYGDGFYFSPQSRANQERVIESVNRSAGEIYTAYSHPDEEFISHMTMLIPHPTSSNPRPLYVVEKEALILYDNEEKIVIKKGMSALKKISSHALKHLPQSYINGFIDSLVSDHLFLGQKPSSLSSHLLIPQFRRLMGVVWSTVGVATYHQVERENRELNDKVDEMAVTIKKTYENTERALDELSKIKSALHQLLQEDHWKEFREAESKIKDVLHGAHHFSDMWFKHQQANLKKLSNGLTTLSRFCMETDRVGEGTLLANYRKKLKQELPKIDDPAIKMVVTLWFRQILELQAEAFALYQFFEDEGWGIQMFEDNLHKQIEINQSFLDKALIMNSSSYIHLQYEKLNTLKEIELTLMTDKK
ncbi:hypothetical protein [Rhabdochlamydiaceae symbiont of Dictyostelium giganteum]|uniref:hypothetical protein n=1 Tax=Rhabdochlamydiaceae symbiont of Dictyostelium giganteum TaxID=3342349 RepID=UPI00384E4CFA